MGTVLQKRQVKLMALLVAGAAIILYWPTLHLPLIYDTLLHIRIATELDLLTVWLPTEAFGFYRPLTFLPMLVIRGWFGYYPATLLHGLNVGQHALNAVLLLALSWRLWRKLDRSLAAGLLLALFPFAYQAVAVYGHNVHLTTAGLILLGLHCYLSGLRQRKLAWHLLTGLFFFLALLSHETAVLFGPLAALVHWNAQTPPKSLRQLSKGTLLPWFIFLVLGGLYAIVYQFLPISPAVPGAGAGGSPGLKLLYLLQSAAHPFAWLSHLLPGLNAATVVLGGFAVTILLTAWSARRQANRLPLLLGWAWWTGFACLLFVSLPTEYVLHGPRLLYLAGIGLALLWPVLLEPLRGRPRFSLLLWGAALGFILLTGASFVHGSLQRYAQLTRPLRLVEEVMADRPPGEGVLLVNLPEWLSPTRNVYPVGAEHVAILGYHLFAEELVVENLGTDRPVRAIRLPDILTDPGYPYAVFGDTDPERSLLANWAPAGSRVFVVAFTPEGPQPHYMGGLELAPNREPVAEIGPFLLSGVSATLCGGVLELNGSWAWREQAALPATLSLFAQALDGAGRLLVQADGPPLGLRADLVKPVLGWQMTDRRLLPPSTGLPVQLLLGVYDYSSGERLPARDSQGNLLPNDALSIPVQECR
jgi:hypothetical protein